MLPDDKPGRIRRLLGGITPQMADSTQQDVKNAPSGSTLHLDGTRRRLKVRLV